MSKGYTPPKTIPKPNPKAELPALLLISTILIFGILWITGSLMSGYHLVDDHEVVVFQYDFSKGASVFQTMISTIKNDLRWRFRPFYWVERVVLSAAFGANMPLWNLYTAVKGVITFCLFYLTARNLNLNVIYSYIFPGIIMFGQQFTPYYRSANQESTGLLLLALTVYLITYQTKSKKYRSHGLNILICMAAILCGFTKESFALCMPAFIAFRLWAEYSDESNEGFGKGFLTCIRNHWSTYLAIFALFVFDVYIIVFQVGTDQVSYAGFYSGTPVTQYITWIYKNLSHYTKAHTIFALFAILAAVLCLKRKKTAGPSQAKKHIGYAVIIVYVLVTQLLAHAKSGMWQRYLIPYTVAYAFFIVVILGFYFKRRNLEYVYAVALAVFLCSQVVEAYNYSSRWANDGENISAFLNELMELSSKDSKILCAFRDGELNLSVECMLETKGWNNVYSYNYDSGEITYLYAADACDWEEPTADQADIAVCYSYDIPGACNIIYSPERRDVEIINHFKYSIIIKQ